MFRRLFLQVVKVEVPVLPNLYRDDLHTGHHSRLSIQDREQMSTLKPIKKKPAESP
jgi:hypothetical protein